MEVSVLKTKRDYYQKHGIPYKVILDNEHFVTCGTGYGDFDIWDDDNELLTAFRKNSGRGQKTYVVEEFTSAYENIQHLEALHRLDQLEKYLDEVVPILSDVQRQAMLRYFNSLADDSTYMADLMPQFTDKTNKEFETVNGRQVMTGESKISNFK